jgi:hypothetical protein
MSLCFFERYPTSKMYEDIVDSLIRDYQYLIPYRALPPPSARVRSSMDEVKS